ADPIDGTTGSFRWQSARRPEACDPPVRYFSEGRRRELNVTITRTLQCECMTSSRQCPSDSTRRRGSHTKSSGGPVFVTVITASEMFSTINLDRSPSNFTTRPSTAMKKLHLHD